MMEDQDLEPIYKWWKTENQTFVYGETKMMEKQDLESCVRELLDTEVTDPLAPNLNAFWTEENKNKKVGIRC